MKKTAILGILAVLALTASAQAALVQRYQMDGDVNSALLNSVSGGVNLRNLYVASSPTHLATGGVGGSGAWQFDGANDYLGFSGGILNVAGSNADYTVSFWIKTTDASSFSGYAGTPEVPVLGDSTNAVGYGMGIDGGKAAYRHFSGSWKSKGGAANVADGNAHYVTFVVSSSGTKLSTYIDGLPDVTDLAISGAGLARDARSIGCSWSAHYGAMIIDDIRIYDTALDADTIRTEFSIPEPGALAVLIAGGVGLLLKRKRRA
jgi:hypothetical protein